MMNYGFTLSKKKKKALILDLAFWSHYEGKTSIKAIGKILGMSKWTVLKPDPQKAHVSLALANLKAFGETFYFNSSFFLIIQLPQETETTSESLLLLIISFCYLLDIFPL